MTTTNTTARIAVVYNDFDWAEDLVKYTMQRITDPNDPFPYDDQILAIFSTNGTATIDWKFQNASCESNDSASAYWDIVQQWNRNGTTAVAPHGLIGAYCSSASKELAVLSTVQQVPQISPVSSSAVLSDKTLYPYFSRLVGPDDKRGQAGALVYLLQSFEWSHVGVVITDEQYSRDLGNEFQDLWTGNKGTTTTATAPAGDAKGSIAYTYEINLRNDAVDAESVQKFLSDPRVTDRHINSRGIVLIAREEHAHDILQQARKDGDQAGFPSETIWIGTDAWVDKTKFLEGSDRLDQGYFGLTFYQNRLAPEYVNFFDKINKMAVDLSGQPLFEPGQVRDYSAGTLVDSIIALTMALSRMAPDEWNNGTKVTEMLRSLTFSGVSGDVAFTQDGDRLNPSFGIFNTVLNRTSDAVYWNEVGTVTSSVAGDQPQWFSNFTTNVTTCFDAECQLTSGVTCFDAQCELTSPPDDTYYVFPLPIWAVVVIVVAALGFAALLIRYCRTSFRIRAYTAMIHTATEELNRLIQDRFQSPEHWDEGRDGLVEVLPNLDEYWNVRGLLRGSSMLDAHISHLWRVQNHSLWAYYSSHKDRWTLLGTDHNEMQVWHGTSNVDPDVICSDPQDGFIMQLAKYGWWGRGVYFAGSSLYSHCYAYRPYGSVWQATYGDALGGDGKGSNSARHKGKDGEREMFLVKLLVGNAIEMPRDANLSIPPHVQGSSGPRYNTVTGKADGGTQVYVVYENGRAYPEYLVRYYRGSRDDIRTPYETHAEARLALGVEVKAVDPTASPTTSDGSGAGDAPVDVETGSADVVSWEFQDIQGWTRYSDEHQALLEAAHQRGDPTARLVTEYWEYEVDLKAGVQTNLQHHDRTQRLVRRLVNVVHV